MPAPEKFNRLLQSLPKVEREAVISKSEEVDLKFGQVLYEPFEPITHVYFPNNSLVSLLAMTTRGEVIEVGMIGDEGVVGAIALMGQNTTPFRALVQGTGRALRVEIEAMAALFERDTKLRKILLRYLHALLTQAAQLVVCTRFHSVEERLVRWLLISHDSLRLKTFSYTQEFLSQMLGADRVSVTLAVGALREAGLISTARGQITVLNRKKLEAQACECYQIVRDEFDQFLGKN